MTQVEFYKKQIKGITLGMIFSVSATVFSILVSTVVITNKITSYANDVDNRINSVTERARLNSIRIDNNIIKLESHEKDISILKSKLK